MAGSMLSAIRSVPNNALPLLVGDTSRMPNDAPFGVTKIVPARRPLPGPQTQST